MVDIATVIDVVGPFVPVFITIITSAWYVYRQTQKNKRKIEKKDYKIKEIKKELELKEKRINELEEKIKKKDEKIRKIKQQNRDINRAIYGSDKDETNDGLLVELKEIKDKIEEFAGRHGDGD